VPADDTERWRVFLAIEVPPPVRAALGGPLSGLEPLREVVRINAIERIHLTLHFLGHIPRTDVEQLQPALASVVARHQRLRLVAAGVGAFPDIRRPRVLWAGIAGADLPRLTAVQADLGDTLRKAGVTSEDRFHPHLTLARVVRPPKASERNLLHDWSSQWGSTSFGEIPADQVRLMRSQLGAGPPRYTTVATFDLQ
jgi:RNA 2',3'-cyclic 3'-phosphodiesterase